MKFGYTRCRSTTELFLLKNSSVEHGERQGAPENLSVKNEILFFIEVNNSGYSSKPPCFITNDIAVLAGIIGYYRVVLVLCAIG